jgi:hypothetical protein
MRIIFIDKKRFFVTGALDKKNKLPIIKEAVKKTAFLL